MSLRNSKVVRVLSSIALRIWAASGAALLICFLLYCFYGGIFAFLLLLVFGTGILYHAQDNVLYHPDLPPHSRIFVAVPSMNGLPYESINIKSWDNVVLHAYLIRHPGDRGRSVPTFVYYHGNAGNMGHRLQNATEIFYNLQCNVFLVEYRGYGLSTGAPSERGLYADARASLDYLFSRHDLDLSLIVVFGRSLGGAVAIDLAIDPIYSNKIFGVIVENTFTSIPEMAPVLIHPSIKYLPLFCYKNKYMSLHKIKFLTVPCLFISGLEDPLVPPQMMSNLHARCASKRKKLLKIAGGTHIDTWTVNGYYQGIAKFLVDLKNPMEVYPETAQNLWPESYDV